MHRLKVITSPSLTRLVATLADDLAGSSASVLERETVVVLNPGMARWISMELATSRGVCAGLDFRFPNEVIDPMSQRSSNVVFDLPTAVTRAVLHTSTSVKAAEYPLQLR